MSTPVILNPVSIVYKTIEGSTFLRSTWFKTMTSTSSAGHDASIHHMIDVRCRNIIDLFVWWTFDNSGRDWLKHNLYYQFQNDLTSRLQTSGLRTHHPNGQFGSELNSNHQTTVGRKKFRPEAVDFIVNIFILTIIKLSFVKNYVHIDVLPVLELLLSTSANRGSQIHIYVTRHWVLATKTAYAQCRVTNKTTKRNAI